MLHHYLTILPPHPSSAQNKFLVFCLTAKTIIRAISKYVALIMGPSESCQNSACGVSDYRVLSPLFRECFPMKTLNS